jgi:hypothetical protein
MDRAEIDPKYEKKKDKENFQHCLIRSDNSRALSSGK